MSSPSSVGRHLVLVAGAGRPEHQIADEELVDQSGDVWCAEAEAPVAA